MIITYRIIEKLSSFNGIDEQIKTTSAARGMKSIVSRGQFHLFSPSALKSLTAAASISHIVASRPLRRLQQLRYDYSSSWQH